MEDFIHKFKADFDNVQALISTISVPQRIKEKSLALLKKLIRHNGPEFAVGKFKDMKTAFIHDFYDTGTRISWLRTNSNGNYSGFLGQLLSFSKGGSKCLKESLKLLMIYTNFSSEELTRKQRLKFMTSAQKRPCHNFTAMKSMIDHRKLSTIKNHVVNMTMIDLRKQKQRLKEMSRSEEDWTLMCLQKVLNGNSLSDWAHPPFKRRDPQFDLRHDPFDGDNYIKSLKRFVNSREGQSLIMFYWDDDDYNEPLSCLSGHNKDIVEFVNRSQAFNERNDGVVGKLQIKQQPGFKARPVFWPVAPIQLALEPLKSYLGRIIRTRFSNYDFTFNQTEGALKISNLLKEGKRLSAFDLSDATNHFPLVWTMYLLESVIPECYHPDLSLFESVSRSYWDFEGSRMRLTVGQPLGLNPSFFAFSLSHTLTLIALGGRQGDFFVLGDDLVISNQALADRYLEFCKVAGLVLSESKCIVSDKVTEFAGCIITSEGVYVPPKWVIPSSYNGYDVLKNWGPSLLRIMKGKIKGISETLSMIPEFLPFGLGFNPRGIPLQERIDIAMDALSEWERTRVKSMPAKLDLRRRFNSSFYDEDVVSLSALINPCWRDARVTDERNHQDSVNYAASLEQSDLKLIEGISGTLAAIARSISVDSLKETVTASAAEQDKPIPALESSLNSKGAKRKLINPALERLSQIINDVIIARAK